MTEPEKNGTTDEFLTQLENAVIKIVKNNKSSKADKLAAINAGVKIAAIKHKISGGDDSKEGFFA